jgi:CHASE3 domain sensor protein
VLPQASAYDHAEIAALRKLVPPTSMKSDWEQILKNLQAFAEDTDKTIPYAQAGQYEAAQPLILAGRAAQTELRAIARRNGFKACSQA